MRTITRRLPLAFLSLSCLLALGACGGGGDGSSTVAPAQAVDSSATAGEDASVPAIATESAPKGPTIDLKPYNLLPLGPEHSRMDYVISHADPYTSYKYTGAREITRVETGPERAVLVTETDGDEVSVKRLVEKSDGIYHDFSVDPDLPPRAAKQIGLVRVLAYPTYAIMEPRVVVRQGVWDEDIDGDGKFETFRLEFSQRYTGMLDTLVLDQRMRAARFVQEYRYVLTKSKDGSVEGFVNKEEVFLMPGLGPVAFTRFQTTLDGIEVLSSNRNWQARIAAPQTNDSATLPPDTAQTPPSTSTLQKFELPHNDVVYDAARNRYYASLPSAAGMHGNAIAVIDAGTAAISYSAWVGSEPGPLALSPDGRFLYVGLQGAGEVVKLTLPSLSVAARISLGSDPYLGTLFAESIAVSPANTNVFAVSLYSKAVSPRHRGVALYAGSGFAPKRTQEHTGSNLIAFNEDGSALFGYNNESTEYGLRRIAVAADGLFEEKVVSAVGGAGAIKIAVRGGLVFLKGSVFDAGDLTQKGQYGSGYGLCEPLATRAKTVCLPPTAWPADKSLSIHDTAAMTTLSSLPLPAPLAQDPGALVNLVPGPSAQVAISYRNVSFGTSSALYLLSDNSLK